MSSKPMSAEEARIDRQKRHEEAESSIKVKALSTIEGMILNSMSEDKMLVACCEFAHIALGHCSNPHNSWREELDNTYKKLREDNII